MDCIFIDELRVDASVGIYPRELVTRQTLEINLSFGVPEAAARNDELGGTIDYASVIDRIRTELGARRFGLLETLGEFVAALLLGEFRAPWVRISIAKIGVAQGVKRVGVRIERNKI